MTASVRLISADVPTPLSVQARDYAALLADGAVAVDIRSERFRRANGALLGAMALDATEVLDLLSPGSARALRSASADARWVLISEDGHEAEWLAWHLQAAGVTGARFVVGGHRAMRRDRVTGTVRADELEMFAVHE